MFTTKEAKSDDCADTGEYDECNSCDNEIVNCNDLKMFLSSKCIAVPV